jgi:hypothetical protein
MLRLNVVEGESRAASMRPSGEVLVHGWDGAPYVVGGEADSHYWIDVADVGAFRFDPESHEVRAEVRRGTDSELLLHAFRTKVLPIALHVIHGYQALHASAILLGSSGIVAFCARSETGKSTIAYGMQLRGYPIWGDDALSIDVPIEGQPTCPRLPFDTYLRPPTLAFFGEAAAMTADDVEEEVAPLAAICTLERASEAALGLPWEVSQLSLSERLSAVLPHAYFFGLQEAGRKQRIIADYLTLLARVPVLRLRFRPGFEHFSGMLDEVERSLGETLASSE